MPEFNVLNVFKQSPGPFDSVSMTDAINVIPLNWGRLRDSNIFGSRFPDTTTIMIERKNGRITLLPSRPRGAPGSVGSTAKRDAIPFAIPHFPHDDALLADALQNVRSFGKQDLETISMKLTELFEQMLANHAITLEYLRWGAVRGVVLDTDGTTELVNLFDAFGITEKSIDFALTSDATNVRSKCLEVSRYIEQNAKGQPYTGIRAFCSEGFFTALIEHESVVDAWQRWNDGEMLRNDPRRNFPFGGITFEEHVGNASEADGDVHQFIPDDTARVVLEGAPGFLQTAFGPGTTIDTVNRPGKPIIVKQEVQKFDAGVDIHTQSNPLPYCGRPELLVELTK